jgi:Protein of unknown function (DUF3047)
MVSVDGLNSGRASMSGFAELEDHAAIQAAWWRGIGAVGEPVRASAVRMLPADTAGWTDTGIAVAPGDEISLFSQGVVWLSRDAGIGFEGNVALWLRIGEGPVERVPSRTMTVVAAGAGPVRLLARSPGAWLGEGRDPGPPEAGGLSVAVIAWRGAAAGGLAQLTGAAASGFARSELARLAAGREAPAGWAPDWVIGRSEVFACEAGPQGRHAIACRCDRDVGILKYPVDVALDQTTRLKWSWKVDALPSAVAEDTLPTHDYLSIAAEFEGGLDLTWMWSAALPAGTVFQCPLPWWNERETHQVVRSGGSDLGRWLDEERPVLADFRRAIGGPAPARIVGVWLIAASVFQRGVGACAYADISLEGADGAVRINLDAE